MTDNLPAIQNQFPEDALLPVSEEADEVLIKRLDIKMSNYGFKRLAEVFEQASTVDEICKLNLVMFKMMKERRDLLRIPYGNNSNDKRTAIVWPAD